MNTNHRRMNGADNAGDGNPHAGGASLPIGCTHIVCIVDRSGSMQPIARDAIGGYNAFLESQKKQPGEAVVTLVLFDHEYFRLYTAVPIAQAPRLDPGNYVPRGTTALLDAMGRTIEDVHAAMTAAEGSGHKVIVAILTDGMENASTDFTLQGVAQRIHDMQLEHGWEFVYLGANQDAISVAGRMNIPSASSARFDATGTGVRDAYEVMGERVAFMRRSSDPGSSGKGKGKGKS